MSHPLRNVAGVKHRTLLPWLRRSIACLVAVAAVGGTAAGVVRVCSQQLTGTGGVVTVCRAPGATDALTLAVGLVLLLLLTPDVAEIGLPGLITLRRRVAEHESELAALRLQIATASTASVVINGLATAPYADGEVPDDVPEPVPDVVDQARYLAAELLTRYVQEEALDVLDGARLHLYLFDDDTGLLTPVLEPEADYPVVAGWAPGQGVVGRAWSEVAAVTARGREVLAGVGSVSPRRRTRYAELAVVTAVPVLNAAGVPVAVVSASSRDPDCPLDSDDAVTMLLAAGEVLARGLVDLLGWATDEPAAA